MPITANRTGITVSIMKGISIAVAISLIITIIFSIIIASYLHFERITWHEAGYWIIGMLYLSAFAGGKCAYAVIKRQRIALSLMTGFLFWGTLLCITALFFGGNLEAVWETAGIIAAGCGTSAMFPAFSEKNKRKRNRTTVKLNKKSM